MSEVYTVRWIENHTVADIKADSEEEAIEAAKMMSDNSYYNSEEFTAVIEEV
jgi:hypothetical protein